MTAQAADPGRHSSANLADPDFWLADGVDEELARLRDEEPISWHEHPDSGRGMWSVVLHEDIRQIGKDYERFVNRHGVRPHHDSGRGLIQPGTDVMITMDPPAHTANRRYVNPSFVPRAVREMEAYVRDRARAIVDGLPEGETVEFVDAVAARLPLEIVCDVLDVPEADRPYLFELSNLAIGDQDPHYGGTPEQGQHATLEMRRYGLELGLERRRRPGEDLVSAYAGVRPDGSQLTDDELAGMFTLMIVAGNETTRTAISQGMIALTEFPDQRARWMSDPEVLALSVAEEILRWGCPVRSMGRGLDRDVEFRGVHMRAGDKVTLWYASGNRDERAFVDPDVFDVGRDPNPSLSFGFGTHFCLGAHLARREVSVIFQELFARFPDAHTVGPPERLRSIQVNGVKRLEVSLG